MNLYTEKQIRLLLDLAKLQLNGKSYSKDVLLQQIAPIQLPNDGEIGKNSMEFYDNNGSDYYFEKGAKWVLEQIKQQSNEH